jgi:protein-S-isoprenylcysteine O-methyltransferase Ste14
MDPGRGSATGWHQGRRLDAALTAWNLVVYAAWIAVPFLLAGSATWASGWVHLGVVTAGTAAEARFVAAHNPALRERRRRIGPGTKAWDVAWNAAFWPLMAAMALVAGAQAGARGDSLPAWCWPAGLAVTGSGFTISAWAMGTNPFFEATVRIQVEAGHRVFEGGPYRWLRHPGYLGLLFWALGSPLLLRSSWSAWAAVGAAGWIVLRTALEDATLRDELPGYAEYTRRTRHRLIPGVW